MESPVRINTGLLIFIIVLIGFEGCCSYPSQSINQKVINDNTSQESSTLNSKEKINSSSLFQPRNITWLYQRRNAFNMTTHPSPSNVTLSTANSTESTANYGNKINFRGSVKYFATRPPFKPKNPYLKRNNTNITNESSEKLEISKSANNKTKISKTSHLSDYKINFRKNDSDGKYTSPRPNIINKSEKPDVKDAVEAVTQTTTEIVQNASGNRSESGKSLGFDFNIDKYTSPEFHDINNVYSQSVSPEVEHFIVPENVSDYYVSVGSAPLPQRDDKYHEINNRILTTPQTDLFDKRFREVSESIKQNLAESVYDNDDQITTEKSYFDSSTDSVNFKDLLSKSNNNNAKIMFKNTKELTLSNSDTPISKHSDYTNANGTKIFYEMSDISTESYDQSSSTIRIIPENVKEEITTTSPISNEVINLDNKLLKKDSNASKIFGNLKYNGTRRDFSSTVRMRIHTTPRPRMRISLKGKTNSSTIDNVSTTRLPNSVKINPFLRRRNTKLNNTLTTVSSKLDPVYEGDTSPTRVIEHARSNSDNSIPVLRKRGSLKYYESNENSTSEENQSEDFTPLHIPPTATAWALISMKDTPGMKKHNISQIQQSISNQDLAIKTEDELQKLEKSTDSTLTDNIMNQGAHYSTTVSPTEDESKLSKEIIDKNVFNHEEITSASKFDYATVSVPESNNQLNNLTKKHSFNNSDDSIHPQSSNNFQNFVTTDLYGLQTTESTTGSNEKLNPVSEEDSSVSVLTTGYDNLSATKLNLETTTLYNRKLELKKLNSNKTDIIEGTKDSKIIQNITNISNSDFEYDQSEYDEITGSTTETVTEALDDFSLSNDKESMFESKSDEVFTTEYMEHGSTIDRSTESNENKFPKVTIVTPTPMDMTSYSENLSNVFTESNTVFEIKGKHLDQVTVDTSTDLISTSENSNSVYSQVSNSKRIPDIETSSTTYYNPITKIELTSPLSMTTKYIAEPFTGDSKTSEKDQFDSSEDTSTLKPIPKIIATTTKVYSYMTIPITSEEISDSREAKNTNIENDEKISTTTNNISDQNDNLEDWIDSPDTKQQDSNEIPSITNITESALDSENADNDLTEYNVNDLTTFIDKNQLATLSTTSESNIEVIKPNNPLETMPDAIGGHNPHETTPIYVDDTSKFEESVDGSGAIAAITISVIGVVALLLLVGVLMVARGRRRSGGYGQRCTPVSLDSYSLDNVSISGSARRKARRPSKRSYGNPAYDESGATSHPMQFAALANFALDQESIISEFNEIPTITARADEVPQGCESKNRYSNVIPLPETRVMLKLLPGDESSDYINANYVRGPKNIKNYYIACQAPLASTVNDFWRMIWEQNSRVILMLTEFMENGAEKCYEYLPPSEVSDSRRLYGDYQIVLKKREVRDKYVISVLQVKCVSAKLCREITHMWYFWPAKGVPEECHSIIAFLIEARSYLKASQNAKEFDEDGQDLSPNHHSDATEEQEGKENEVNVYDVQKAEQKMKNGGNNNEGTENRKKSGPLVVHCSPGTGRTGALIACDIGIRDFEMSRTVDIPKTVYRIRRDRANAVQTKDQYIFIYKVLSEYATKLTGGILDSI